MKSCFKKNLLAGALAACLLIGQFTAPMTAYAKEDTASEGEEQAQDSTSEVTEDNKALGVLMVNGEDINIAKDNTVVCGEGTAVYDTVSDTLTLTNATLTKSKINNRVIHDANGDLNIKLVGSNKILAGLDSEFPTAGGIFTKGNLTIMGDGTLDITSGTVSGIIAEGNMTIDGAAITANTAGDGAILACGDLVVINNSKIESHGTFYGLSGEGNVTISASSLNASASMEKRNGIIAHGNLTIDNQSTVTGTSAYPSIYCRKTVTINSSSVIADSTNDAGIYSEEDIVISETSQVSASGYYSGINALRDFTMSGGKVSATSTNDMGIYVRGTFTMNGGELYAKGGDGKAAVGVRYDKQSGDTEPAAKIVVNDTYGDVNGGKISVSDWFEGITNEVPWTRSWTSFIHKDDTKKLSTDRSNALNEVTIRIKNADYTKVDEAVAKANTLEKDKYIDFSGVEAAINAIIREKDITEQTIVDGYAATIEQAIAMLELKPVPPPVPAPSITEGANQTIEQGKAANFRSSGDIKDFQKVLIDGKELPASNYTIKSGSTIVTLNTEYTKTLTAGRHTISIVSKTGHANAEFTIKAASTPTAPTLGTPVLKAQSLEYNTIGLQWNKIDRASGYVVYRRYKNNGCGDGCYSKWKMITEVNDSLQFQDTRAVTGRQYQYMIKAYMNEGTKHIYSPMSRYVSCKAVPSTPTVRARAYRNTTNKVSWSKTAGAQKYYIYRKTTSKNAKWEKIAVLKSNARSFDDRKAKKGKKYIYAVRAYRREGCISYYSNYGNSKIVKTKR